MVGASQEPRAYRTDEAARRIGCSKSTLLRWFREGKVADVARDRRGWRIFRPEDIQRIKRWAEAENRGAE
jgi:excisionase family DNA binding protein